MSQNNVDFSGNPSGSGLMDDYLDKDQQNVLTSNSGIQRPSYAVAGTKWLDTSVTPWVWKMYDGTSDVTLGTVNPSTHLFIPAGVLPSQEGQSGKFLQTNGSNTVWTDAVDYTNITNCITAIPQDIKLELNNGTVMLKAGSKVYRGDGTAVTVNSDENLVAQVGFSNVQGLLFYNPAGDAFCPFDRCFSGDTAPSVTGNTNFWYDTANKIVKYTNNAGITWRDLNISLSIAIVSVGESGAITSIDQVFNGFGYIGNNTFILPGVKGLRTNGFNADGSLNSFETVFTQVTIPFNDTEAQRTEYYLLANNQVQAVDSETYAYNRERNVYINTDNGADRYLCFAYSVTKDSTGRITSFKPKTVFQAADYQDVPIANFYVQQNTSGTITANMVATGRDGGDARISTSKDVNGNITTYAPTPAASDNSSQIATTAWVKGRHQVVSVLPANPDPNTFYYIPEG